MSNRQQPRRREQLSVRLDVRIIAYYDGLVETWRQRWSKDRRPGTAPTRNWFIEQRLGLDAGIEEAVDWREGDEKP